MNTVALPDVATQASGDNLTLDWVGMCGVALPIQLENQRATAKIDAGVSLDKASARGIHMSRLYLGLEALEQNELSPLSLRDVLEGFLESQEDLSDRAYLRIETELLLRRPALISPLAGWKSYPVVIDATLDQGSFAIQLRVDIGYSSTCPCSAALARQLIQNKFRADFAVQSLNHDGILNWLGSPEGIIATPHSQRSSAQLCIRLHPAETHLPITALIDQTESALGTAVQTAVKRADEQAFALANGQNLMFCEDAARRLSSALNLNIAVVGYKVRVVHAESLHAHDAVAEVSNRWTEDLSRP